MSEQSTQQLGCNESTVEISHYHDTVYTVSVQSDSLIIKHHYSMSLFKYCGLDDKSGSEVRADRETRCDLNAIAKCGWSSERERDRQRLTEKRGRNPAENMEHPCNVSSLLILNSCAETNPSSVFDVENTEAQGVL